MRVGVIFTAYNTEDYLGHSLFAWLAARRTNLGGHTFVICVVSVPFEGFDTGPMDGTQSALRVYERGGEIDHLIAHQKVMTEVAARGAALQWLVGQDVDVLWQVDSDEVFTDMDITATLRFIEQYPLITWFRTCLKNLVFDTHTYLTEPFTPPRIHRVRAGGYKAHSFYDDNNVLYGGTITRDLIQDTEFASMTVPKTVAWPRHFSWLNDSRSKRKIAYQLARQWPSCSFAWDDSRGGLIWNDAHFARLGQPIPETTHE